MNETECVLILLITGFFTPCLFLRSHLLWKRTGVNAMTFNKTDDEHGTIEMYLLSFPFGIMVILIYAFKSD